MTKPKLVNEPVAVTVAVNPQGEVTPHSLTWQGQPFIIVGVGRQWEEPAGRSVLVETADNRRFELQLRRDDLIWYARRIWQAEFMV